MVWGGSYQNYLNPLMVQHKRIIRTISHAQARQRTNPLFLKLGLLRFQDIYKFNLMVYMFKCMARGEFSVNHDLNTGGNDPTKKVSDDLFSSYVTSARHISSCKYCPVNSNFWPTSFYRKKQINTFIFVYKR